jgi:hypothetical protein
VLHSEDTQILKTAKLGCGRSAVHGYFRFARPGGFADDNSSK